ncbi:MAG: glycosyltransferase family 2 protein [Acidobacteriota bacterium]|nr:glycosyltransferase family 2 protein [Acidobacteriota bacterium]
MWVFYFFGALLVWQGVVSLLGGWRYWLYYRREMARPPAEFTPRASVIVPCRGVDQGLRENFSAIFGQNYPEFEIVFVADHADDPALKIVEEARLVWENVRPPSTRVIIAGAAIDSGQKVHNLIAAVQATDPASEVLVFVDTDARPHTDWLRALVAPLVDESVGAATGYRWFVPVRGGLSSHLRAVWNASIASALGERRERNFCWGGSTAIRHKTFEKLEMLERWRGTLSDDFALTNALQAANLPVHFVPQCLTASFEDCTFGELLKFTTRQVKITRVYAPHLWKFVLAGNLLFVTTFFGGLALVISRAGRGESFAISLSILVTIFLLGVGKAFLRLRAVSQVLTPGGVRLSAAHYLAHLTLWPLTAALYLYNAIAAGFSRRITWRGITYELQSPTQTNIVSISHLTDNMTECERLR